MVKIGNGAVGRKVTKRSRVRAFNGEGALSCLKSADFGKGREVFGFNKGQFSAIDLLDAAISYTGPADVTIATWTAANADVKRAEQFLRTGRAVNMTWLVDRSFQNRQPEYCALLRETFGDDCIRVYSTHAKFMLVRAGDWRIILQTSMNLNQNNRLENFWLADDPELFEAYAEVVAECFELQAPGAGFKDERSGHRDLGRLGTRDRASFYDVRPGADLLV